MTPTVPEFYSGKTIFITGGTGFVGKSLVEKLLRSCPEIKNIYLLLRQKKGQSSEERLKDLCSNKVFELVKLNNPGAFKKLKVISGDITLHNLGITDEDRRLLVEECEIIFHSAACVRFDQKLKDAVNMNTTGTFRILSLAEEMKKLQVFVHLSTAYCRCQLDVLEEKLYKAVHNPRHIMNIVEWMDDETLNHLEPRLISSEPNTYSYTKAITEDLVAEYESKFPVAIARPSIVTAAWKEPFPGWVDNLNGATGLLIGSGKGVIRTMHCEPTYTADAIAVDVVVNACILIAFVTALDKPKETQVYNLTLSKIIKVTWNEIIELGKKWMNVYPYSVALWYPGGSIKSFKITHKIHAFFVHLIPAYLVDGLLYLLGMKTFMINLQKRIDHGLEVIQYYTTKEWHFTNKNFQSLRNRLSEEDNETFFTDFSTLNADEYLKIFILGTREFCCKEDLSTLPRARRLHTIRFVADIALKLVFFFLLIWFCFSYCNVLLSSVEYLDTTLKNLPISPVKADIVDVENNDYISI